MIFLHCFECRFEVTPSRRCVVLRMGNQVSLAPTTEERLAVLCKATPRAPGGMPERELRILENYGAFGWQ